MRRDALVGAHPADERCPGAAPAVAGRPARSTPARVESLSTDGANSASTVTRMIVSMHEITPQSYVTCPPLNVAACNSPTTPDDGYDLLRPPPSGDLMLTDLCAHVTEWMVVCGHSAATRQVAQHTLGRFDRFAAAHAVTQARAVTPELVARFVQAVGSDRREPSVATMHQRRSVIRLAFRLYHRADPAVLDPTYDLVLPSRSTLAVRPLTDDEIDVVRAVSLSTLIETRQPAIVALAEAGAVTTEIAAITGDDLDLDAGTVSLPGARHATPRVVPLTPWGTTQLARRSRDSTGPLTYRGGNSGNAAQASVSVALRRMFNTAGLAREHDLNLASIRAWAGRRSFDHSEHIEDAARVLGCRSLDTAARLIGWEWS